MINETPIELKQTNTTIAIKRGTKVMLDNLGSRSDTYDEIIRKLIRAYSYQEEKSSSKGYQISEPKNRIQVSYGSVKKSIIYLNNGERISFTYNKSLQPFDSDFRFMINYAKIIYRNKEIDSHSKYKSSIEMAKDYLKIIEKIIRTNIDPLFRIKKKHILDLEWWRRVFNNLGLPSGCYKSDIEEALLKLGIAP